MFPRCGFGVRTFSSLFTMNACLATSIGPENPSSLNRRTNSRRETGLGMYGGRHLQGLLAERGEPVAVPQLEYDPVLKDLLKLVAATLARIPD